MIEPGTVNREARESRRYQRTIEVCRQCEGKGRVWHFPPEEVRKFEEGHWEPCRICKGSGMVRKLVTTITEIEPYYREQED